MWHEVNLSHALCHTKNTEKVPAYTVLRAVTKTYPTGLPASICRGGRRMEEINETNENMNERKETEGNVKKEGR